MKCDSYVLGTFIINMMTSNDEFSQKVSKNSSIVLNDILVLMRLHVFIIVSEKNITITIRPNMLTLREQRQNED